MVAFFRERSLRLSAFVPCLLEAQQLARILCRLGLICLSIFAVLVAFDSLPLRLLDPDWILNTAATLVNLVTIPLVAMVFIHISGYLSESTHRNVQRRIARLAALFSLLFFLILPMLGLAVVRNANNLKAVNQRTMRDISKKGRDLKQAVQSASSFNDLKTQMQRLKGPQIVDASQSIPLPELKQQLLKVLAQAEASVSTQLIQANSPSLIPVYKRVVRTGSVSLLGAVGFALLAWDPFKKQNLLVDYVNSFKIFGTSPGSLRSSLVKILNDYKAQRVQSSNMAKMRATALVKEREIKKLEAQRQRDRKRNSAERRKQEERLERQQREKQLREEEKNR